MNFVFGLLETAVQMLRAMNVVTLVLNLNHNICFISNNITLNHYEKEWTLAIT